MWAPPNDPFTALRLQIARRVEVTALWALLGLCALLPFRHDVTWVDWSMYPTIALMLGSMLLLRSRFPGLAGSIGGVGFIALVTAGAWFREGLGSGVTSGAYALAVVVSGLLWGPGKTILLAILGSAAAALLAWHAPAPSATPLRSWGELTAILVTLALFVELSLSALGSRIADAQASRQRFQQLFDGSPDGLVLIDDKTRIQLINPAARAMLGFGPTGAVVNALTELPAFQGDNASLIGPLLEGQERTPGETADQSGETTSPAQDSYVSLKEGSFHEVALTALSAPADTTANHWLVTIKDVSERVAATRAHREFEAQLAHSKSLEALGRLAGGVAHDFNNLLTVILGTTDLVLDRADLEQSLRQDILGIQSSAERAAELTSQLLAFGRKQVLEPAVFCPNDSLQRLQPLFERLVPSHIELQTRAHPELGYARIDPARLEQVLVNLATNAADAMPTGGTLTITTENLELAEPVLGWVDKGERAPEGRYVCLTVGDTGMGMDESTQARVFDPFYTTKALGKGTGLGLATVFGIVRQSGGYIRLRSQPGEGTLFQLLFPRLEPQAPSSRMGDSPSRRGATRWDCPPRPLHVLLVEDNSDVRDSVYSMLTASGHRVSCATDGQDALRRFAASAETFDALLTDVIMPHMNGRQLATALREAAPDLRVLFITGYTGEAILQDEERREQGVLYLAKPFTRQTLDRRLVELFSPQTAELDASST